MHERRNNMSKIYVYLTFSTGHSRSTWHRFGSSQAESVTLLAKRCQRISMPSQQLKIDGEKTGGRKLMKRKHQKLSINASQIFGQLQKRTL